MPRARARTTTKNNEEVIFYGTTPQSRSIVTIMRRIIILHMCVAMASTHVVLRLNDKDTHRSMMMTRSLTAMNNIICTVTASERACARLRLMFTRSIFGCPIREPSKAAPKQPPSNDLRQGRSLDSSLRPVLSASLGLSL